MPWLKKGLIFNPKDANLDWLCSHAAMPCVEHIGTDLFHIYFAARDALNRSQIGRLKFNLNKQVIIDVDQRPVLSLGDLGTFDDSGLFPCQILSFGGVKYLYYVGWSLGKTVPMYSFLGVAANQNDESIFSRLSKSPILGRNKIDPFLAGTCWVLQEDNYFRMWYSSGVKWVVEHNKPKHYYHIKYAESSDGLEWERSGHICIDFNSNIEYSIGRPCVLKEDNLYKMWYSYRASKEAQTFRIGYAESLDGLSWQRKDKFIGLSISADGWDSESVCFPCVFKHDSRKYLLYNGNGYGASGFGIAVWRD